MEYKKGFSLLEPIPHTTITVSRTTSFASTSHFTYEMRFFSTFGLVAASLLAAVRGDCMIHSDIQYSSNMAQLFHGSALTRTTRYRPLPLGATHQD
jgi:hypothetical protein